MELKSASSRATEAAIGAKAAKAHHVCCRESLPYLFEKELINKQNRHVHVVEKFVPSFKILPITDKFYAKKYYPEPENFQECLDHVQRRRDIQRRQLTPVLESQVYGWLPIEVTEQLAAQLNFVSAPKLRDEMTIFGEKLFSERITRRPSFNGLRFFVK